MLIIKNDTLTTQHMDRCPESYRPDQKRGFRCSRFVYVSPLEGMGWILLA